MHTSRFVYFLLIAVASHAYAGAGQTSSGVTTTVPTSDPTAATQGVQEQSSNFAQQNQALAGSNGVNGTAGTVTGVGTVGGAKPGQAGTTDANGKPIDPNNPTSTDPKAANAPPAAPAAPPAPPPEYVSNVKKVDRSAVVAAAAPVAAASADKKAGDATKAPPPAEVDPTAITAPGMQRQASAQKPAPRPAAEPADSTGAEHVAVGTGSSGGSGAPPDSYAFYIGLIVAGALLAFAAAMFLRVEKGGAR
jgi:hypothetical protein